MTTNDEVWLPIPGTDGQHEASSVGRIRSWVPWRNTPLPRIRKGVLDQGGYLCIRLRFNGVRTVRKVHFLVMLAHAGPRPDGLEVRHLDGDQLNNRLSNLAYGTKSENQADNVLHEANTYTDSANRRHCRRCDRERKNPTTQVRI